MKLFYRLIPAIIITMSFAFAACEDDPVTPVTPDEETIENILAYSDWECVKNNSITYMGIQMDIETIISLNFIDSVSGEMFTDIYIEVPAAPSASQNESQTESFTYKFTGDKCKLHVSYFDTENDVVREYDAEMTYKSNTDQLVYVMNDPEMTFMTGSQTAVFERIK